MSPLESESFTFTFLQCVVSNQTSCTKNASPPCPSPVMHIRYFSLLDPNKGPSASWFLFACFALTQLGCKASKLRQRKGTMPFVGGSCIQRTRTGGEGRLKSRAGFEEGRRLSESTLYLFKCTQKTDTAVRSRNMAAP